MAHAVGRDELIWFFAERPFLLVSAASFDRTTSLQAVDSARAPSGRMLFNNFVAGAERSIYPITYLYSLTLSSLVEPAGGQHLT